jgi:hypothetical protein
MNCQTPEEAARYLVDTLFKNWDPEEKNCHHGLILEIIQAQRAAAVADISNTLTDFKDDYSFLQVNYFKRGEALRRISGEIPVEDCWLSHSDIAISALKNTIKEAQPYCV